MIFNIFGVKLKLEFSFFLIIAFALLLKVNNLLFVLLFASLHEAGHIISLLILGEMPDSITVSFYGIGLKHNAGLSLIKELVFLLSGVAVNFFFFVIDVHREINLPLLIVNLLPVVPLDGGRALSLLLPYKAVKAISVITLFGLTVFSVLTFNVSLIFIIVYIIVYSLYED